LRLLCGGLTGAIVKTTVAPVERLKILTETQTMFTSSTDKLKYKGIIRSATIVWRESGFRGFFRGNGANLIRVVPNSAIKFTTFDSFKKFFAFFFPDEKSYFIRTLCSGALSGAIQVVFTYPLDVVRTRMAVYPQYKGISDCFRQTLVNEGPRAFYQGIFPTIAGVMPYVGISLTVYDSCKKYLFSDTPMILRLVPGIMGSICAGCVTFPFDVVRRRMQLQGSDPTQPRVYHNSKHCVQTILRKEGLYGLYRGISLQILRSAPSTSLQFVMYDFLKKMVGLD